MFVFIFKYSDEVFDFNKLVLWNYNCIRGLSFNVGVYFNIKNIMVKVFKLVISDIIDI